jgi:hypothetical protein
MTQQTTQQPRCELCGGTMSRSRYCGVFVCDNDTCGDHRGLVRCYCGWSFNGGNGYDELLEYGEQIEPEY